MANNCFSYYRCDMRNNWNNASVKKWGQYEAVIIMIVFALPYVNLLKEGVI